LAKKGKKAKIRTGMEQGSEFEVEISQSTKRSDEKRMGPGGEHGSRRRGGRLKGARKRAGADQGQEGFTLCPAGEKSRALCG